MKFMIPMETWLHSRVPDNAIELVGHHTIRADKTADDSGKTRVEGLCIYVNKGCCMNSVIVGKYCLADLSWVCVDCSICQGSLPPLQ